MSACKVSIRVPVGASLPELADFAVRCEEAGLDGVGVPDHHHTGRDAYLVLGTMAARTGRLSLFPATSNVVTRHPIVLAALANSLEEVAPGRTLLTVAPGFLSVENAGERTASRSKIREVVPVLRGLLSGGQATYAGHELTLTHRPQMGSRVLLLASGPKLLELAGAVADGVMMMVGLHPDSVHAARECVRRGAESAGRDVGSLEEILIVPIGLGDEATSRAWPQSWFRAGRPWLCYPSASNLHWLRYAGIDLASDYRPEDVNDKMADEICDALGLFGAPGQVAERLIRAEEELGVKNVYLFPAHSATDNYELPRKEVDAFARVIGPALRGSAGASTRRGGNGAAR